MARNERVAWDPFVGSGQQRAAGSQMSVRITGTGITGKRGFAWWAVSKMSCGFEKVCEAFE